MDYEQISTKPCERCGQPRKYFTKEENCKGCQEINKLICGCGHPGNKHRFLGYGLRANKRYWVCTHCEGFGTCMNFTADPIKQELRENPHYFAARNDEQNSAKNIWVSIEPHMKEKETKGDEK